MSNAIGGTNTAYSLHSARNDDDDGPQVANPDDADNPPKPPTGKATDAVGGEEDPWAI